MESVRGVLHLRGKVSRWSELQFQQRWDSQWTRENVNTRRPRFGLTFSAPWVSSRKTRMYTLQTGWKVEHQWESRAKFFLEGIFPLRVPEKMADVEALDAVDFRGNHPRSCALGMTIGTAVFGNHPQVSQQRLWRAIDLWRSCRAEVEPQFFCETKSNIVSFRSSSGTT